MRSKRDREFSDYVSARHGDLYRLALLLCGDPHRADDIVQNALAKLYTAWPRAQQAGSLDAYVRRMVVNSLADEYRRPWRRESPSDHEDLERPDQPAPLRPEELDELWSALRRLAIGQRRVVLLRHYWGLSVEETAADLGVSPGTVKSQTSDAIAHLRRALTPAHSTGEQ